MSGAGGLTKGKLRTHTGPAQYVEFSYNPTEVVVKKTSSWKPTPTAANAEAPNNEFKGTGQRIITMTALFDDNPTIPGGPKVLQRIEMLMSWTNPTLESRNLVDPAPSPPQLLLEWGQGLAGPTKFYLTEVTATYTMFTPEGAPIRATAALTLGSIATEVPAQNPTSGSEPGTRAVQPVGGDSLASIAYDQYGDAALWRALAEANGIDDPFRMAPGGTLLVPPTPTARRLSAKPGPAPRA